VVFEIEENLVGLGRFELPTNGLGNERFFVKSFRVTLFVLEHIVLFRAELGMEFATQFATSRSRTLALPRAARETCPTYLSKRNV
jgi:hypothetical protein